MLTRLIVICAFVSSTLVTGLSQATPDERPPHYGQPPNDLLNALVQMARASSVPLVAELACPLPEIPFMEGVLISDQTLNRLLDRAPGYAWRMDGKVLYFYNSRLTAAHFDFLNLEFPRFTVPPNLSDLKLWFPSRTVGLLEGFTGEGGATSGFGDPLLEKQSLPRVTLENISARQVLLRVANDSPVFYVTVAFANESPTKDEAEKAEWHWGSLKERLQPIYTQPPPRDTRGN